MSAAADNKESIGRFYACHHPCELAGGAQHDGHREPRGLGDPLLELGREGPLRSRRVGEHDIPALDVRRDVIRVGGDEDRTQVGHLDHSIAANVDPAKQCDVGRHRRERSRKRPSGSSQYEYALELFSDPA